MSCLQCSFAKACDVGEDFAGCPGPFEWPEALVAHVRVAAMAAPHLSNVVRSPATHVNSDAGCPLRITVFLERKYA